MPPPSSSSSLVPLPSTNSGAVSLTNQKGRSQNSQHKSADNPGRSKAKTQQPNKLVELFRQVDNAQTVNSSLTSAVNAAQFVNKGSLSSNNQMLMRTMQMQNNSLANGGA